MLRIAFCTLLLACSTIVFTQENKLDIIKSVKTHPIYKGCQSFSDDNVKARSCMAMKFNEELANEFSSDLLNPDEFDKNKRLDAKISFVITKNGFIEKVTVESTNHEKFAQIVTIAVLRIAHKVNKNHPLEPGRLEDGTPVSFLFRIPVSYINQ